MGFHEVRFPVNLSFGSSGGPERRTEIVTLTNGFEERSTPWEHSRRRYDAGLGMRSLDDLGEVIAFFEARRGQLFGFRWKDWVDFKSVAPSQPVTPLDQIIGQGDGTRKDFRLGKTYVSGVGTYQRPITKPVATTVRVAVGGVEKVVDLDWTLQAATGTVTFALAPAPGAVISAGFEFDVPVRFDTDRIQTSIEAFQGGEVPSVPVVELRV
ncbi:MAG: TIGR02217 family protein [Cereibacter sp.]